MTTSPSAPVLTTRNATLADLAALLRNQQSRKLDVVTPATALRSAGARLVLDQTEPQLSADGVTMTTGAYTPTEVCDDGLADKLNIPAAYLRRLRTEHPGLYDASVNGWLARASKSYLVRCLRADAGGGVARAFLSSSFKMIDLSRARGYPAWSWAVSLGALLRRAAGWVFDFFDRDNRAAAGDPLALEQMVSGGRRNDGHGFVNTR
jgi:hypothetical protein